jgi:EAL domain-containing protein (putative c-di-GMP-specific phosphodiesterase class I)
LTDNQFVPFFQPFVTLRTGQIAGFEVLARWRHPTKGLIPPGTFIPLAERDGWICALTQQILKKALAAVADIPGDFTIAFNVSPLQLRDLSLPEQIRTIVTQAGFPLSRLIVEVTESALIDDLEHVTVVVAELKAMGCRLALDDFGTGYSSLHHLQSLPFDKLKVDRSFVSSMMEKRESRKIVSAVVGLGQSLGLTTVAEGIETREQAEMMVWLGCELGQGYFYGRPMPSEELAAFLSTQELVALSDSSRTHAAISPRNLESSPSQRLAQLQALYDGAPIGLGFVDRNLRYINLNKRLAEINGLPVESLLGAFISDVIPDMFPYIEPYLVRALGGEATLNVEVRNPSTGETRLINYQPAFDEANEVVGVAIAVSDIEVSQGMGHLSGASEVHCRSMMESSAQSWSTKGTKGRNPDGAKPATASADGPPLRRHEIIALSLVAGSKSPDGINLGEIAREMHKVGLVQAASLAVNSLRRRKFIVSQTIPSPEWSDGGSTTGLLITPYGQEWLDKNQQAVSASKLPIHPSTEPESLIELLSTLRFRG